jgi:hypothetical protein
MVNGLMGNEAERAVIDIITGTWQAQALYAAVVLNIPDHIAAGQTDRRALATATNATQDGIERLMRLLVALGVFTEAEPNGYGLSPIGEKLRAGVEGSLRDLCRLYGEEFYQAWSSIVPAITAGEPGFQQAFGKSLPEYLAMTPGAGAKFQRAMNAGSSFFADVAAAFDFAGRRSVVDVAGGGGLLLGTVLRAHPHLHGILFDLPHMIPLGERQLSEMVGIERIETIAGSMFERVPRGADVYLLSRVLQDWDDTGCAALLANCRAAMTRSARLLIVERVVPEDGSVLLPLLWDLHLLMMVGGRERTLAGYRSLLDRAGLRLETVHPLALETSLLVAAPATTPVQM